MKITKRYKGFIPLAILMKNSNEIDKSNSRALIILIIANLVIIPINVQKINEINHDKYLKEVSINVVDEKNYINSNTIMEWLELCDETVINIKVENNTGEILTNSDEIINLIEEKGFCIDEIDYEDKIRLLFKKL